MLDRLAAALLRALHALWQWLACTFPRFLLAHARRGWLAHAMDDELAREHPDAGTLRRLQADYFRAMLPALTQDMAECQAALAEFEAAAAAQPRQPPCCASMAAVGQRVLAGLRARDDFLSQEMRYYRGQLAALQPGAQGPAASSPPPLPAFRLELAPEARALQGGGRAARGGSGRLCEACREHLDLVEGAEEASRDQQQYLASLPPPKVQPAAAATAAAPTPAGGGQAAASAGGLRRRQG